MCMFHGVMSTFQHFFFFFVTKKKKKYIYIFLFKAMMKALVVIPIEIFDQYSHDTSKYQVHKYVMYFGILPSAFSLTLVLLNKLRCHTHF